jgi:hypothetical protein
MPSCEGRFAEFRGPHILAILLAKAGLMDLAFPLYPIRPARPRTELQDDLRLHLEPVQSRGGSNAKDLQLGERQTGIAPLNLDNLGFLVDRAKCGLALVNHLPTFAPAAAQSLGMMSRIVKESRK